MGPRGARCWYNSRKVKLGTTFIMEVHLNQLPPSHTLPGHIQYALSTVGTSPAMSHCPGLGYTATNST